jgi:serine protease
VINLSVEFESKVRAWHIPDIVAAVRHARSRGVTVIAAAGNTAGSAVAYPARARRA